MSVARAQPVQVVISVVSRETVDSIRVGRWVSRESDSTAILLRCRVIISRLTIIIGFIVIGRSGDHCLAILLRCRVIITWLTILTTRGLCRGFRAVIRWLARQVLRPQRDIIVGFIVIGHSGGHCFSRASRGGECPYLEPTNDQIVVDTARPTPRYSVRQTVCSGCNAVSRVLVADTRSQRRQVQSMGRVPW